MSHDRTGKPVVCRDISHQQHQEIQRQNSESEQVKTLLDRQREQILADCQAEIRKHEFQDDNDRRSIQKMNETVQSQQEEICRAHQGDEPRRQDHQLLHEQLLKQNWDLRETHEKSLNDMKELLRFQGSTFDSFARRKIGRGSNYYHWQDARRDGPPSICDTHGILGNVFANPAASSSAPCPQELNPWSSGREEPLHSSTVEKSGSQTQDQDQRCQSRPSARNSVIPGEGDSSKNYGADQQRLQISDLHFDKFPTPATFACWKIRFKTEVFTCSQFPTEAMLWIKEVELVDSVDGLKSSCSVRGIRMPNFEVLDAKIAAALNRIIHNAQFKRKVSLVEQKSPKRGPFPSRKTDRLPDLRVLPDHKSQ